MTLRDLQQLIVARANRSHFVTFDKDGRVYVWLHPSELTAISCSIVPFFDQRMFEAVFFKPMNFWIRIKMAYWNLFK